MRGHYVRLVSTSQFYECIGLTTKAQHPLTPSGAMGIALLIDDAHTPGNRRLRCALG